MANTGARKHLEAAAPLAEHGASSLPAVHVDSYNAGLRRAGAFIEALSQPAMQAASQPSNDPNDRLTGPKLARDITT
jgi:hypothetical protein